MLQHDHILKAAGPVIQILLIGKTAILFPVIAPLKTSFTPPVQTGQPVRITPKGKPANVIDAVSFVLPQVWWEAMADDGDGTCAEFLEEGRRTSEEEEIGIQVGDEIDFRPVMEDIQRQGRRTGEVVFNPRTILLGALQRFVMPLELVQGNWLQPGESELF